MKTKLLPILILLLIFSCSEKKQYINVANNSDTDVTNKKVILNRSTLNPPAEMLPVLYNKDGEPVISQLSDTDNDGEWDQLVFQTSLTAGENVDVELRWVTAENYPVFDPKTQVYFGYSEDRTNEYISLDQHIRPEGHVAQDPPYMYQFEGPGWENNLVGYRIYFDPRNGKDIFGKTTEDLILQNVALGENYHELQPWGMDVLKVGSSLGAGSLGILKGDSLFRLGVTDYTEFRKLEEGPVFSRLQLIFKGWDVKGASYELTENITIWANKRWYSSEVMLPGNQTDTLVTGIVNLLEANVQQFSTEGYEILMTHGIQSENKDAMGMALLIPGEASAGFSKASEFSSDISDSELALITSQNNKYQFYFYTGWEQENQEFSSIDYFQSQLESTTRELQVNLDVTIN